MIQTVLNEEERGTRRREGRGGKRDEEERGNERKGATRRKRDEESEKNEKVVKT